MDNKFINEIESYTKVTLLIIGLIGCCVGIAFSNIVLFCVSLGSFVMVLMSVNNIIVDLFSILLLITIICLVNLSIVEFEYMPQAYVLLKENSSLIFWFNEGHFHAVRLLITYPAYIFSNVFNAELNVAYGYYCAIIFTLLYSFLNAIKEKLRPKESKEFCANCIIYIFVVFLAIVMNGRICFAFLGFAILLYELDNIYYMLDARQWKRRYINIGLGLVLSTVSSGTMVVCATFFSVVLAIKVIRNITNIEVHVRTLITLLLTIPIGIKGIQYIIRMINKNIAFYGGGFQGTINMLQHGVGRIFGTPSGIMIIWLITIGLITVAINIYVLYRIRCKRIFILILGANICFYGLFVGFSTGSLILIPTIIIGIVIFNHCLEKWLNAGAEYGE